MDSILIREFFERTGVKKHEDAFEYLTMCDWDVDMAVMFCTTDETESDVASQMQANNNYSELVEKMEHLNLDDVNNDDKNVQLNNDEHPPCEPIAEPSNGNDEFNIDNGNFSFVLPNIFCNGKSFFRLIKSELIDSCIKSALENSDRLNWWSQDTSDLKLWPTSTLGDGNCLLHAVSISMWGIHDTLLTLRKKLYGFLQYGPYVGVIKRRWKWYQSVSNAESGLVFTDQEWAKEWDVVVNLAAPVKKSDAQHSAYDGLEEIHILALAYLLQRTIIVISDTFLRNSLNEAVAPIPFGGIYMPIGCNPMTVCKSPIVLGYDSSHFAPLLCMEKGCTKSMADVPSLNIVPLVDIEGDLLRIKFHYDPGENYNWETFTIADCKKLDVDEHVNLLKTYLKVLDLYNLEEENVEGVDKQKSQKQQSLGKQLSGIGKSMSKTIVKKLSSLGAKSKNVEFVKYELLCAEITPRMGFTQTCLREKYMQFTMEKFYKKQPEAKRICIGVGSMGLGPFKRPLSPLDETSTLYSSSEDVCMTVGCNRKTCSNCKTSNQQSDELHEYGIGKSTFYKRFDEDFTSQVVPLAKPLSNQTLYLSNSTFYNDNQPEDEEVDLNDLTDTNRKNNNSPSDNNN